MSILMPPALLSLFETPPPPDTQLESLLTVPASSEANDAPHGWQRVMPRIHPRILVGYGSAFGAAMVAAASVWSFVIRDIPLAAWFPAHHWLLNVAIGLVAGIVFALLAIQIEDHIPAFKRIEIMFLAMLDMRALRWHHAVMLGLLAGIPEEILFRGTIQPELGLVPTSIIFGALHAATPAYFIYATIAGLALGVLAIWRDGLWSAIAAHTVIDVIMFLLLIRTWQRSQIAPPTAPPAPDR